MNANGRKSVAKDHLFFFVRRLRRFPQIVLFLICENPCHLRIDPSDRIIFPAYSIRTSAVPLVAAGECESTQIGHNRFAIIGGSWSICLGSLWIPDCSRSRRVAPNILECGGNLTPVATGIQGARPHRRRWPWCTASPPLWISFGDASVPGRGVAAKGKRRRRGAWGT